MNRIRMRRGFDEAHHHNVRVLIAKHGSNSVVVMSEPAEAGSWLSTSGAGRCQPRGVEASAQIPCINGKTNKNIIIHAAKRIISKSKA